MNRFRELREDNDLLQKDVAFVLSITQQQYSRIEKEINELSYDGLIKLSEFYNVSIDYMLCLTNSRLVYPRIKK